jgi:hypothetical protein
MSHIPSWSDEKRRRVAAELQAEARRTSLEGLLEMRVAAFATCRQCRRIVPLDLRKLADACGVNRDVAVVEVRLRCASCGNRGALIGIVWPESGQGHLRLVA